jgi:hypothetical protein
LFSFPLSPIRDLTEQRVQLTWDGLRWVTPEISAEPFAFKDDPSLTQVIREKSGRVIAATKQVGEGKVLYSLVTMPSAWKRSGNELIYKMYWSHLLSATLSRLKQTQWQFPTVSFVNAPTEFFLMTNDPSPTVIVTNATQRDTIYLMQDLLIPNKWHGEFRAKKSGWLSVKLNSSAIEESKIYINDRTAWKELRQASNHNATSTAIFFQQQRDTSPSENVHKSAKSDSRLIFFLVLCFVLSAGFLWAESRFSKS